MPTATREIIRGLAGGAGFLVAWLFLAMPWWLAGALGIGLYTATSFLLPAAPSPQEPVAPGVTAQERDAFVAKCQASTAALRKIASRLAEGDLRSHVENLAHTTGALADYLQRKPEAILAALGVPLNLEHLLTMLCQYVELSHSQVISPGETVAEVLQKVEATVGNAALAFAGMHRQLLDNDVAALQASAKSLDYLLGVEPDLERERRRRRTTEPLDANLAAAGADQSRPRPRQWHTEKPL